MAVTTIPPRVGDCSPWGPIQHITPVADGLVFVSTARHGGLWVRADLEAKIPKVCQDIARQYAPRGWYEEDCDCAIPIVLLPGFSEADKAQAIKYMRADPRMAPVMAELRRRGCGGAL